MSGYHVAYIINHYPKVSHTFIRREIIELERRGLKILRVSIRGWDDTVIDPDDVLERDKTTFVLKAGVIALIRAMLAETVCMPRRFFTAAAFAIRMMAGSDRPIPWHIVYLAEACWVAKLVRRGNVQHLHAHFGTNPTEVAALTSILTGITFSFTAHGPEEFDKLHSVHLAKKIERAAFVVAISSFCRSQLYRVTGHNDWAKIKVIHCGVDQVFARLDYVTHPDGNRLVNVGRLTEQKGQILLVEAVAELIMEIRDLELILVGDGELRPQIETLIERHGLDQSIQITGWATTEQVRQKILTARAIVLPSFAEGLPIALMEAMALQRPVLATMINGIPELVSDGETGWLFPAGSKRDLKNAIRKCLATPSERLLGMGRAARRQVLDRYRSERQAELLLEEFNRFLVRGPTRQR